MTEKKTTATATRRSFVKGTTAAAATSTFFIGRSAKADDPEHVCKVATVAPPGTPWAKQLQRLKKVIKKESEGRIKVKTYLGGALGGERQTAEATKRGSIQIFGGTASALASLVPELDVLELAYLFPSEKKADKVLDTVIREDLENLLWDRGFKLMFYSENGYRSVGSNFAISGPAAEHATQVLTPLRDLFAAVFFLFFGLSTDPADLPPVLIPALILAVVTMGTKVLTGYLAARKAGIAEPGRWRAGFALTPRGEFSIVIAGLAVSAGADRSLAALATAYVLITIVVGPLLARIPDTARFDAPPVPC